MRKVDANFQQKKASELINRLLDLTIEWKRTFVHSDIGEDNKDWETCFYDILNVYNEYGDINGGCGEWEFVTNWDFRGLGEPGDANVEIYDPLDEFDWEHHA